MDARRGYVPEDDRNFSPDSLETMRKASGNICYLLEEGYELKQAAVFVGNHFLLSERQRLAIMRSVATKSQLSGREDAGIKKATVLLDEPVSNSGRLKALIADAAEEQENTFLLDIRVIKDVDHMLYDRKGVITSDSIILDHCESWVNLVEECMKRTETSGIKVW